MLHITASKKAVVKTKIIPQIGRYVFDGKQQRIGRVCDVFGPIVSPYVEVDVEDPEKLLDNVLYVSSSSEHEVEKRKK